MRNVFKAVVLAALIVPAAASAAISNTQHNLSTSGPSSLVRATAEGQICIFCHTPHGAGAANQRAIWNHTATAQAAFTWGTQTQTVTGTTLPTTLSSTTLKCLGCHDGTIAVGAVSNRGGGLAGTVTMGGTHLTAGGLLNPATAGANVIGNGGSLGGSHPVGIPYAGQTGSAITNPVASGYYAPTQTGCTNSSTWCTTANTSINLIVSGAVRQVDCTSCHDPHGTTNAYLLVVPTTGSQICLACHNQ